MSRRGDRGPIGRAVEVLRDAVEQFFAQRVKRLSAGLAYYTLFALIPTLALAVGVAGAFVGREAAAGELADQMSEVVGAGTADQLESLIAGIWSSSNKSGLALFGLLALAYSASILFVAWRDMVELIWDVPFKAGIRRTLTSRALAALVPVGAGVLLAATIFLQGLLTFLQGELGSKLVDFTVRVTSAALQTAISILALMVLYRYSARNVRPSRRDIFPAVVLVVVVLNVGYWAYGIYLRHIGSSSVAGAASGVFLGLIVLQLTAQVLLFGAVIVDVLHRGRTGVDTADTGDVAASSAAEESA